MAKNAFDLIVIGAGPGGYVAAIRAAQLGMQVGCVEKRETLGGTCLNVGCIPSKALLQSTEHYHILKDQGEEFGIEFQQLKPNLKKMMQRKKGIVSGLCQGIETLFAKNRITWIKGEARFIDEKRIEVAGDEYSASSFILATGSEPIPLPFLPFDEKGIVSSTGALALAKIPKEMVVVGGGVIGVELASVYQRIGSHVTVVEMLPEICPMMEPQVSKALRSSLEKLGITFHLGTKIVKGEKKKGKQHLTLEKRGEKQTIQADVVLVSVGRRPYSEGLGLEEIGVLRDERGFVKVNEQFSTSVEGIYAIGDLIEGAGLAHRASSEGEVLAELLAGHISKVNYMAIPNVIYTAPEVASVGMTEQEAKELGLKVRVGSYPMRGNPRARAAGQIEGIVKVIAEEKSDRLIGMHIVAQHASEMIHAGMVTIQEGGTLLSLSEMPFAHPTLSEAIKEAAASAHQRLIHG